MLTEKEKKAISQLEDNLSLPKWKFVLIYGVLAFGLIMAVATGISDLIFDNYTSAEFFNKRLWVYLLTGALSGLGYGLIIRWLMKKQYQKLKVKEGAL